ncbi:hypothetical protein ACSBR2_008296 [Camellia fascicularis]
MWCQWVKSYLLKGKSFRKVKVPNDPSWVWRKLLSLRDWVSPLIKHKIGCGDATFLWYDNWHPLGPLWNKFRDRIIYDSALNSETKVSQIIDGSFWKWPIPNSWEIQELISSTPVGCKPNPSSSDTALWKLTTDGQFSIQSAWNHWRKKFDKVVWHKLVWGPHRIPKVSFIVWVALHNRLYTGDRLRMFGLATSSQCRFCLIPEESHSHLFFKCIFSSRVWCAIEAVCNIKWPVLGWPDIVTHATKETKGNSLRVNIISNAFLCSVYFIWTERNNIIFNKEFKPEEVVIKSVIQMVKDAIFEWCERLKCGPSDERSYIECTVTMLCPCCSCWKYLFMTVSTGFTIMFKLCGGCIERDTCYSFDGCCCDGTPLLGRLCLMLTGLVCWLLGAPLLKVVFSLVMSIVMCLEFRCFAVSSFFLAYPCGLCMAFVRFVWLLVVCAASLFGTVGFCFATVMGYYLDVFMVLIRWCLVPISILV